MITTLILAALLLILFAKFLLRSFLSILNMNSALRQRAGVPEVFADFIAEEEYQRSILYSLKKERLSLFIGFMGFLLPVVAFLSPLPFVLETLVGLFWDPGRIYTIVYVALFFFLLSLPGLPLEWYSLFVIEEEFGFNRVTPSLYWKDALRSGFLWILFMGPLFYLILAVLDGEGGWLYLLPPESQSTPVSFFLLFLKGAGLYLVLVLGLQLLAPLLILPLFNKLLPLEEGELKDRLLRLAKSCGFGTRGIYIMDGSKRSSHSNAYFTGLGPFRRIVLFDTLLESLSSDEIEAVLAHEIGHFKKGHILKRLVFSCLGVFFALLMGGGVLLWGPVLLPSFGFTPGLHGGIILGVYLIGTASFFFLPLQRALSRGQEYQADRYACEHSDKKFLASALVALGRNNLLNLTPHPLYSRFYHTHPTLGERLKFIEGLPKSS